MIKILKSNGGIASTKVDKDDPKQVLIHDIRAVLFNVVRSPNLFYTFYEMKFEWNHGLDLRIGNDREVLCIIVPDTLRTAAKNDYNFNLKDGDVEKLMNLVINEKIQQRLDDLGYEIEVFSMPVYKQSYGNSYYITIRSKCNDWSYVS